MGLYLFLVTFRRGHLFRAGLQRGKKHLEDDSRSQNATSHGDRSPNDRTGPGCRTRGFNQWQATGLHSKIPAHPNLALSVRWLRVEYAASERRVCGLMGMAVTTYRYRTQRTDEPLRTRLVELAREKPRFGYRRLHVLLRRSGEQVNHKRLHRVYREAGLSIRRKKRKHCVREGKPLVMRTSANQEWALDFVHDAVECGRTIRVLSVVDAYTRECLALEVDTSFASRRVTRVLDQIITERGRPEAIRCDNGPELTSRHFLAWCVERQIELVHIQPGKPTQNGRVESFNGRLREECLNLSWFQNLFDAWRKIAAWRIEYNEERPHRSPGVQNPERVCDAGGDLLHRGARSKGLNGVHPKTDTGN